MNTCTSEGPLSRAGYLTCLSGYFHKKYAEIRYGLCRIAESKYQNRYLRTSRKHSRRPDRLPKSLVRIFRFLAGQLALQAFRGEEYAFSARQTLIPLFIIRQFQKQEQQHSSWKKCVHFTSAYPEKKAVVLCDSITITENLYENNWYEQLPWSRTVFIADDSHGLGVMGPNGTGIYRKLKSIPFSELVVCGSLSKGFAVQAGAVFSSAGVIARLWDHPFFAGASPASPAAMATFRDAIPLYEIQRKKLTDHIRTFDNTFSSGDMFRHINGHPSYAYTQESLTRYLLDKGILTTAFHYPDVASPMVRRIVLSASHTEEDLAYLSACLKNFLRPDFFTDPTIPGLRVIAC